MENLLQICPAKSLTKQKSKPLKIFLSHCGEDKDIVGTINSVVHSIVQDCEIYIAEREYIGQPLTKKLKEEAIDSNAMLIVWTKNAKEKSCPIISFEAGMAWANHKPIFILKEESAGFDDKKEWFYPQLTDYAEVKDIKNEDEVKQALSKFNFAECVNPLCFCYPQNWTELEGGARNSEVIDSDGVIKLISGFNGILDFVIGNHSNRLIRGIRIILRFSNEITIDYTEGGTNGVQQNEPHAIRRMDDHTIRVMWDIIISDEHWARGLRLIVNNNITKEINSSIDVTIQAERHKKREINIPLLISPQRNPTT